MRYGVAALPLLAACGSRPAPPQPPGIAAMLTAERAPALPGHLEAGMTRDEAVRALPFAVECHPLYCELARDDGELTIAFDAAGRVDRVEARMPIWELAAFSSAWGAPRLDGDLRIWLVPDTHVRGVAERAGDNLRVTIAPYIAAEELLAHLAPDPAAETLDEVIDTARRTFGSDDRDRRAVSIRLPRQDLDDPDANRTLVAFLRDGRVFSLGFDLVYGHDLALRERLLDLLIARYGEPRSIGELDRLGASQIAISDDGGAWGVLASTMQLREPVDGAVRTGSR